MRITTSFYKRKNIIYISLYGPNKYPVFKRTLTMNILETILWCNRNPIIITTL
jgi:hypothetical protein